MIEKDVADTVLYGYTAVEQLVIKEFDRYQSYHVTILHNITVQYGTVHDIE
jgi:1,4-alpha-glucan branching enzyme